LAKNTPIFAIYKYQFGYKNKKINHFENLFNEKNRRKTKIIPIFAPSFANS
jgi:hypothetical protein